MAKVFFRLICKDRRRGVPYIWTVSHLADCRGLASPRSFLAAIEQAVADSDSRYPEHNYAWHYESIKRGIQEDLQRLGMLEIKRDNRVDMPDLYRVGFKLGRRGGVRPVK